MLPNFEHPSIVLYWSVALIVILIAAWKLFLRSKGEKGAEPELCAVAILLLVVVLQSVLHSQTPPVFSRVDMVGLLADIVYVVGFVAIALNANRIWPLLAAGAHLLGLFSHFSRAVQLDIAPMAYALLNFVPSGLALLCILAGLIGHFQRMKKFGYDQDWIDWSHNHGLGPSRG